MCDIGTWKSGSGVFEIATHRVHNSFGELVCETNGSIDLSFAFAS